MADDGVRAAARAVRQFLPELVGPESELVDREIVILMSEPGAEPRLRQLLERREGTRVFLGAVLDDDPEFRPPQVRPSTMKGGYGPLPGRIGSLGAPKFCCPIGDDFDWWLLSQTDA